MISLFKKKFTIYDFLQQSLQRVDKVSVQIFCDETLKNTDRNWYPGDGVYYDEYLKQIAAISYYLFLYNVSKNIKMKDKDWVYFSDNLREELITNFDCKKEYELFDEIYDLSIEEDHHLNNYLDCLKENFFEGNLSTKDYAWLGQCFHSYEEIEKKNLRRCKII